MEHKPANLKEFVAKSIITRNANRDADFQKYALYYEKKHCYVCESEHISNLESSTCSKCKKKVHRICAKYIANGGYLCNKCVPNCISCGSSESKYNSWTRCNKCTKIICYACLDEHATMGFHC